LKVAKGKQVTEVSAFREGFDSWIGGSDINDNPYNHPGRLDLLAQSNEWTEGFTTSMRCHPTLRSEKKAVEHA